MMENQEGYLKKIHEVEVEILDDNNKIIGYLNSVIVTRDHDREVIGLKLISQGEHNETISALGRRENTTIRRN